MRRAALCLALLAPLAGAARAATPVKPAIVALEVAPAGTLPAEGRTTAVSVAVRHAQRCTFLSQRTIGGPLAAIRTVSCAAGRATATLPAVPNTTATAARIAYAVRASSAAGTVERHGSLAESAPQAPPAVVGLVACTPGPECDYGPADAAYPTYGNPAPATLGSAAVAAAADWERVVVGVHPDETAIAQQFAAAGGTDAGLTVDQLFAYWQGHGITGLELMARQSIGVDRSSVETAVRGRRALIASLAFSDGLQFGPYTVAAGVHPAVVDGFTPTGPLVVTWGQTFQIGWALWSRIADGLWAIGVGVP